MEKKMIPKMLHQVNQNRNEHFSCPMIENVLGSGTSLKLKNRSINAKVSSSAPAHIKGKKREQIFVHIRL